MKLPKYVQAYVDRRDSRAYYYLRRRGFPRVRLPGLPWSPTFMAAYESALAGPRTAVGAGRVKPGSVAAVVAEYFDSQSFFTSKSPGTQRMRRGILERFRARYGDRPFALLPAEWIEALLDSKPPHAARSWLATLRSLCKFAIKPPAATCAPTRPQTSSSRPSIATDSIAGPRKKFRNSRRTMRSARSRASRSRSCSTPHSGAPMWSAWAASTSRTVCSQ